MRPKPYNPCADGFAAKAWECLRRNEKFKKFCIDAEKKRWAAADSSAILDPSCPSSSSIEINEPFLNDVINCIYNNAAPSGKRLSITDAWPAIADDVKNIILDAFRLAHTHKFTLSDGLPQIKLFGQSYSVPEINGQLREHEKFSLTHDLIAVPKFIWGTVHKKQIQEEIKSHLEVISGVTRLTRITGSTLGTEQEWNTFLDYEDWKRLGFERQEAANLAAERKRSIKAEDPLYGVKASQGTDAERKKAANIFLRVNKPHAHRMRAEGRISNIEKAIASVCPSFSPFSSK